MRALEWIAEQRIREAIEQGKLDNLPGAGRPLKIELDHHLPPELRMAYSILRNAGFVPPVIELRRTAERERESLRRYVTLCARYARDYRERIRELWNELQSPAPAALLFRKSEQRRRERQLTQMVEAYISFRENARAEALRRLRRARACVQELQQEWLRENQRRPFKHGVDLSLIPQEEQGPDLRDEGSLLRFFEEAVPRLDPELTALVEGP